MRSKDEFTTLFKFLKDYVAPLFAGSFKISIEVIGIALAAILDTVGLLIKGFEKVIGLVKGFIDISKSIGSGISGFFSGASMSSPAAPSAPVPSLPLAPVPALPAEKPRFIYASSPTNITVNGAIDSESTARQIVSILNDSSARGTLGGSGLVFA